MKIQFISFKIDWFELFAEKGTLKSLPQHHSLKTSILYGPTLTFIHDYWKNHGFDYMNLCKMTFLLFSMLSRFVIAFLPRCKHLLILWLFNS